MRKTIFLLVALFLFLTAGAQAQTVTPISITSCQPGQANDLQSISNNMSGNYVLANNINCSGVTFQPIGSNINTSPFLGTLNGQGYEISGLTISQPSQQYVGLFARITNTAAISNIVFNNATIVSGGSAGVLAAIEDGFGVSINDVIVENSSITGEGAFPDSFVGALAGEIDGSVENCSTTNVSVFSAGAYDDVGGLAGAVHDGKIIQSYSTGSVSGAVAGGLVGLLNPGTITNAYSKASIQSAFTTNSLGGLIGEIEDYNSPTTVAITNAFAAGKVTGTGGGIVGSITGYPGIIQDASTSTVSTYWDKQAVAQATDQLTTTQGETTAQMYQQTTYVGWDFTNIWTISNGFDYPHLKWENATVYIGNCQGLENMNNNLQGNYVLANDITDCDTITNFQPVGATSSAPFVGTLDGKGYSISSLSVEASSTVSGIAGLFGFMNGAVSDLYIKSSAVMATETGYAGLLAAQIGSNGTVNNVTVQGTVTGGDSTTLGGIAAVNNGVINQTLANVDVTGSYLTYAGGIVGTNLGSIQQSASTGTVQGTSVGGLVGANNNATVSSATIQNSYSTATVILPAFDEPSDNAAGGLIGEDWNDYGKNISDSYAAGLVEISGKAPLDNYSLGGAIGILYDPSGNYSTITAESVYWDKQTTKQDLSADLVTPVANGKTTAQMHEKATFVNWDFTTPIWVINGGYPYLTWAPVDLTIKLEGSGMGTITSTPSGIDCSLGSDTGCTSAFTPRQPIVLTFTTSDSSSVTSWGKGCTSTTATTCTISLVQNTDLAFTLNTSYIVNASADTGGVIAPSGPVIVDYEANQAFTVAANSTPSPGYSLDKLLLDGKAVSVTASGDYTLKDVKAIHTLVASFYPQIAASAGTGGTISLVGGLLNSKGIVKVLSGKNETFKIIPKTGYNISGVLVDGTSETLSSTNTYTFYDVTAPHTISASFGTSGYMVTASAGAGGSISPTSVSINYNGSQLFTLTPDTPSATTPYPGYSIDKLLVDGNAVAVTASGTYNLQHVKAEHMLTAIFDPMIAASASTGGTIAVVGGHLGSNGLVSVISGGTETFAVTPKKGYNISSVLVDGSPAALAPGNTYTFYDVIVPHTIAVTFATS